MALQCTEMLIRLWHLWDRLQHVRSRADDLARLRQRLTRRAGQRPVSAQEQEDAARLRQLRDEVCATLGPREACAGCARGYPPPHGRFDGGHSCGGGTDNVYSADELAALRLGGSRPRDLRAPRGEHSGCIFRGPRGCSLPPAHRPNICVSYLCNALERELAASGELDRIEAICKQMQRLFHRFLTNRTARLADEALAEQ